MHDPTEVTKLDEKISKRAAKTLVGTEMSKKTDARILFCDRRSCLCDKKRRFIVVLENSLGRKAFLEPHGTTRSNKLTIDNRWLDYIVSRICVAPQNHVW